TETIIPAMVNIIANIVSKYILLFSKNALKLLFVSVSLLTLIIFVFSSKTIFFLLLKVFHPSFLITFYNHCLYINYILLFYRFIFFGWTEYYLLSGENFFLPVNIYEQISMSK